MVNYQTAPEIELALEKWLNPRRPMYLLVPNVKWGFGLRYEADLLVMVPAKYLWEIEIKISMPDFRRDFQKRHQHDHGRVRQFFFAIPESVYLANTAEIMQLLQPGVGLLVVYPSGLVIIKVSSIDYNKAAAKLTLEEQFKLARLGALRVWTLKQKLLKLKAVKKVNSK